MIVSRHACALVLGCLLLRVLAQECEGSYFYIDIHDRVVSGPGELTQYGLWIGLGTSSLPDGSLWPAITRNETTFAASDFCGPDSPPACQQNSRGVVSPSSPTLWQGDPTFKFAQDGSSNSTVQAERGNVTLTMLTQPIDPGDPVPLTLEDFPAVILSNYSSTIEPVCGPAGVFGLGHASQVLSHMRNDNLINTKSYGLYMGSKLQHAGQRERGSLVLGGYDAARFQLPLLTYNQSTPSNDTDFSPFKVSVTSVSLHTPDGQTLPLTDSAFDAYLTTSQKSVRFPDEVTAKLISQLGASPTNNDENTLRLAKQFGGELTITFSDALTVRFDASWLSGEDGLTTPISAGNLGRRSNPTESAARDTSKFAVLGAAFLTRAYLFVNHDAVPSTFSLAQVVSGSQDPVATPFCADSPLQPQSTTPASIQPASKISIVGVVVGSLVGVIFLLLLAILIFRRRIARLLHRPEIQRMQYRHGSRGSAESLDKIPLRITDLEKLPSEHNAPNKVSSDPKEKRLSTALATSPNLLALVMRRLRGDGAAAQSYTNLAVDFSASQQSAQITLHPDEQLRIEQDDVTNKPHSPHAVSCSEDAQQKLVSTKTPQVALLDAHQRDLYKMHTTRSAYDKSLPHTPVNPYSEPDSQIFFNFEQPPPLPGSSFTSKSAGSVPRLPSMQLPSPSIEIPVPTHPASACPAFLRNSFHPSNLSIRSVGSIATLPSTMPPDHTPSETPVSPISSYFLWRPASRSRSGTRRKSTMTVASQLTEVSAITPSTPGPQMSVATAARLSRLASLQAHAHDGLKEIIIQKSRRARSKSRGRNRSESAVFPEPATVSIDIVMDMYTRDTRSGVVEKIYSVRDDLEDGFQTDSSRGEAFEERTRREIHTASSHVETASSCPALVPESIVKSDARPLIERRPTPALGAIANLRNQGSHAYVPPLPALPSHFRKGEI